ncbi:MAG: hypothetical protein ISR85_01130 [Kiritimatiellales bacterium]|nr:hypothetical protein [Kiritimatiellota bacterium]MBL7011516.1 hypothetical protein [Kiritimatiellales bacterium]
MKPFAYSIWLMPCAEQRAELAALIQALSNRYATPAFAPHTTFCSGTWNLDEQDLRDAFGRLAVQTAPVELTVRGIDWADHWAFFFFLRLAGGEAVFKRAPSRIEGAHLSSIGPHLSLLYGLGAAGIDRDALRQELAVRLPPRIRFNSLTLVRPSTGRWEDVGSWENLCSARLGG